MAWYRLASWTKERRIPAVSGSIQRMLLKRYGLELIPGADIGGGFYIAHPVGCTLVASHIGENVTVIAAVTIGYRKGNMWPRIGNNVYVGSGARILGDLDVGDGAVVGANAVVVSDVAADATVVGVPARVAGGDRPVADETER
jgi:serine O-acetyltransferase